MITPALLLVLSLNARAQTVPAEPTPADMAHDISAQAEKDPAGASANLNDLFKKVATQGTILPTWKEVQANRAKRDWGAPTDDMPAPGGPVLGGPRTQDYQIGYTHNEGDIAFSRPLPRVELGAGVAVNSVYLGDQLLSRNGAVSASMRINLARVVPRRKLFHLPTLAYTQSDITPSHVLVGETDYTSNQIIKAVTHPLP
jgi:hypothetical protein